jgi:hypothetical protein
MLDFYFFFIFESATYEKIVENNLLAHRGKTLALLLLTNLLGKKFRVKILLWICRDIEIEYQYQYDFKKKRRQRRKNWRLKLMSL